MSIFSKIVDSIGGGIGSFLNDLTGVSGSARQQYGYNSALQSDAQSYNTVEAEKERAWQTEMSNTARQRAVTDLQQAGLNPVLASGAEASSGAGASATSPGASTGAGAGMNPISIITDLINTSNNSSRTNADIRNSTNLTDAQVIKTLADAAKAGADKEQIEAILGFYRKHGVFPGATIKNSGNVSGGFGLFGGGFSNETPIGLKGTPTGKPKSARETKRAVKDFSYLL